MNILFLHSVSELDIYIYIYVLEASNYQYIITYIIIYIYICPVFIWDDWVNDQDTINRHDRRPNRD
jgi:hypothetical protein